jgi:hypothetical protein
MRVNTLLANDQPKLGTPHVGGFLGIARYFFFRAGDGRVAGNQC